MFNQTLLFETIQFRASIVFVNTQLNVKTLLFQSNQFSISTLVSSICDIERPYYVLPFRTRADLGAMAKKGTPHSPKLQRYWNLTIRLFSIIFRTLIGGGVSSLCREAVGLFYSYNRLSMELFSDIETLYSF